MKILTYSFIFTSLMASNVNAQQCDINFNYGVVINPSHLRIMQKSQTFVQINNDKQLFIRGREVSLNEEQINLINQYSQGIRKQVPEIVDIAIEGVDIGLKAVNKVIAGLTGENSASHQKIQERFDLRSASPSPIQDLPWIVHRKQSYRQTTGRCVLRARRPFQQNSRILLRRAIMGVPSLGRSVCCCSVWLWDIASPPRKSIPPCNSPRSAWWGKD